MGSIVLYNKQTSDLRSVCFLVFCCLVFCATAVEAKPENYSQIQTSRFILYLPKDDNDKSSFPVPANQFLKTASRIMNETSRFFQNSFNLKIDKPVVLRVVSPAVFFKKKRAPSWANALYKNGEILIPESKARSIGSTKLQRILRHEYAHAVIARIAKGRCPVWLDEGIAQFAEGNNSALNHRLKSWLKRGKIVPFTFLENSFISLGKDRISAVYSQALFAVYFLKNRYGLRGISAYLRALRTNPDSERVFEKVFGQTFRQFEKDLAQDMERQAVKIS